jgi:taurine dioxygenase
MSLKIEPLATGDTDGVIVRGVTEALLEDQAAQAELRRLWIDRGLIVFKTAPSASLHVALSRVFGDLEQHPVRDTRLPGNPDLIELAARPGQGSVYEIEGRPRSAWTPWHMDLIYMPKLNHGGILRGLVIPREGGATGFMDKIKAYEGLPQALKDEIDDLSIVYEGRFDLSKHRFTLQGHVELVRIPPGLQDRLDNEERNFPPVVHPLVFVQPETGRKILNFSPLFAESIAGLGKARSEEILKTLAAYVAEEAFTYIHQWSPEDMVLWDNWRMLHCGMGVDPQDERVMQRTTIAGDYSQGRLLN